jgi:multidrug efflux system outer membrane protein
VRRAFALAAAAAALCGCTLEPAYVRPVPAVPSTWPAGAAYPPASAAPLPALSWREVFRDPHLQALIAQALADNQDLRAALANVVIARAEYRVQRAQLLPRVNAAAGLTTGKTSRATDPQAAPGTQTTYDAQLGMSAFEIDLFGRLRSLSHAAQDRYFATEAGARAARLTLVAEVASAYLTLATDRSLLSIAVDTETSASRTVDLTRARLQGGVAPRSDLRQAQTILDQAKSDRADLTTVVAQDRNALELLLGAPAPDAALPAAIEDVDGLLGEVPAGLDSHILLRRPDVEAAEYQLRAANAQIGAARAAFFPTISLTAAAGLASPQLSALFHHDAFTWTATPAASLPLFAGGANLANLAQAHGQRELAVAQYQKAIQTAFREIADALARRGTITDQMAAQSDLEAAALDSYALADARYRQGVDPFLSSLDAQRTLYAARRTLASTRLTRADNLVTLYRTLGADPLLDAPAPAPRKR